MLQVINEIKNNAKDRLIADDKTILINKLKNNHIIRDRLISDSNAVLHIMAKINSGKEPSMQDTDIYDTIEYSFCYQWELSKRTFIPDYDFFKILDMPNEKIYPSVLKRIKYPCFAIEFKEPIYCRNYRLTGAIVNICDLKYVEENTTPEELKIRGGEMKFNFAILLIFDSEQGYVTLPDNIGELYSEMKSDKFGKYITFNGNIIKENEELYDIYRKIINFSYYLCSTEADITNNEKTQSIVNKIEHIKNPKIKEKRMKDFEYKSEVGTRIGKRIRLSEHKKDISLPSVNTNPSISRKPMAPHIRGAHWSHRWHGHGDEKVLKPCFIEPTFINLHLGEIDEVKQTVGL